MFKKTIFILWDHQEGVKSHRAYLDKKSAEIALGEHYTKYWIDRDWAKIQEMELVSFFDKEVLKKST